MRSHSPRAFIIVIILAIAAVITALVAAQLASSGKAQVTGIRVEEEVRARAIAEACLEMLTSYADRSQVDAGPGADFDNVLQGPDGAFDSVDDYLAFDARIVLIPASAAGIATDPERRLHQWNLIDIPGSGGVCAARFDDNSDDARGDLLGVPPEGLEGGGADVPNRDRDLSIYLTAIGLYPLLASTADDDAYARAHARVTVRRLLQRENLVQPRQPALWATNAVTLFNNNDVCGPGGVRADDVDMQSTACACGVVEGSLTGAGIPTDGDTCTCAASVCAPAVTTAASPQPNPPANVHWGNPEDRLANEAWGAPLREDPANPIDGEGLAADPPTANAIAAASNAAGEPICSFFVAAGGALYVWDRKDVDARASLTALAPALLLPGAGPIDCTSVASDPLPVPCDWNLATDTLTCAQPASACWKLMATLNGTVGEDVGLGVTPQIEHTSAGIDEVWAPKRTLPIPNVAGGQSLSDIVTPAQQLCGAPTSCAACGTALGANTNDFLAFDAGAPDTWRITNAVGNDDIPHPSIFVSEVAGDVEIGSASAFLNVSVVSRTSVTLETSLCCATCDCALVADGDLAGGCALDAPFGSGLPAGGDAAAIVVGGGNRGIAVKSAGAIVVDAASPLVVVGDLLGNGVRQSGCLLGALVALDGGTAPCATSGTCNGAHACVAGDVIGDVHSMTHVEATSGAAGTRLWTSVVAKQNVCLKNGVNVAGAVQSGNAIEMRNNATIINTTTAPSGATQAANAARRTFMEPTW